MKGLLYKDVCVLRAGMSWFLLWFLVLALYSGTFLSVFAIFFTAVLPYAAIASDEQSGWDRLAAMLPYTARDLVLSKYVLGWGIAAAETLASVALPLLHLARGESTAGEGILWVLCGAGLVGLLLALALPLMLRFGVERGRLAITIGLALAAGMAGGSLKGMAGFMPPPPALPALLLAAAVAANAISVFIAVRAYGRRDR